MRKSELWVHLSFVLMILFVLLAFVTSDFVVRKIMASLCIVIGAFVLHRSSGRNKTGNNEHTTF